MCQLLHRYMACHHGHFFTEMPCQCEREIYITYRSECIPCRDGYGHPDPGFDPFEPRERKYAEDEDELYDIDEDSEDDKYDDGWYGAGVACKYGRAKGTGSKKNKKGKGGNSKVDQIRGEGEEKGGGEDDALTIVGGGEAAGSGFSSGALVRFDTAQETLMVNGNGSGMMLTSTTLLLTASDHGFGSSIGSAGLVPDAIQDFSHRGDEYAILGGQYHNDHEIEVANTNNTTHAPLFDPYQH